jgi:hypothetical protein
MDMDIDDSNFLVVVDQDDEAATMFACLDCRRKVCDTCSVRNGGEERMCLGCAMNGSTKGKRWVGGLGWM